MTLERTVSIVAITVSVASLWVSVASERRARRQDAIRYAIDAATNRATADILEVKMHAGAMPGCLVVRYSLENKGKAPAKQTTVTSAVELQPIKEHFKDHKAVVLQPDPPNETIEALAPNGKAVFSTMLDIPDLRSHNAHRFVINVSAKIAYTDEATGKSYSESRHFSGIITAKGTVSSNLVEGRQLPMSR